MFLSIPMSRGKRIGYGVGCLMLLVAVAGALYPVIQQYRDASDRVR
jgi:hypothetical protein